MIELLSDESNCAIVQLPGRKFPGVVIQGDSLFVLYSLADELKDSLTDPKSMELAEELLGLLRVRLLQYESVLRLNNRDLPYVGSVTTEVPDDGRT